MVHLLFFESEKSHQENPNIFRDECKWFWWEEVGNFSSL